MIEHGERLKQIIDDKYNSINSAANSLSKAGYDITSHQLYALIRGQWPTKYQVDAITEHFDVEPECFLFGKCYMSRDHAYLMEALSPNMQKMAAEMSSAALQAMVDHISGGRPRT